MRRRLLSLHSSYHRHIYPQRPPRPRSWLKMILSTNIYLRLQRYAYAYGQPHTLVLQVHERRGQKHPLSVLDHEVARFVEGPGPGSTNSSTPYFCTASIIIEETGEGSS